MQAKSYKMSLLLHVLSDKQDFRYVMVNLRTIIIIAQKLTQK